MSILINVKYLLLDKFLVLEILHLSKISSATIRHHNEEVPAEDVLLKANNCQEMKFKE